MIRIQSPPTPKTHQFLDLMIKSIIIRNGLHRSKNLKIKKILENYKKGSHIDVGVGVMKP